MKNEGLKLSDYMKGVVVGSFTTGIIITIFMILGWV